MIYFLKGLSTGLIKIGTTRDLATRMRVLQSQGGQRLEVLVRLDGGHREERAIHERFAAWRAIGEWFLDAGDIREYIDWLKRIVASECLDSFREERAAQARRLAERVAAPPVWRSRAYRRAEADGDPIEEWMLVGP